jgi:hypothetical protein
LNWPGADEVPEVPKNISATLIGPNAAEVSWTVSPRTEYHHVWKKVADVDDDFILIGSPSDPDFMLEELSTQAQILIAVSALNSGGESRLSEPVTITMP